MMITYVLRKVILSLLSLLRSLEENVLDLFYYSIKLLNNFLAISPEQGFIQSLEWTGMDYWTPSNIESSAMLQHLVLIYSLM